MALKVVALAGGVGGARMADGLAAVLPLRDLTVVVNTGDDFEHLGLTICPDLDTVLYTLAGLAHPETGWGRSGETWRFLETLTELGGPGWFRLGDSDLALHIERTRRLALGEPLSGVMDSLRQVLGVPVKVLPMSDDPVRTKVLTAEGEIAFQEYFVARRCEPVVVGFRFEGAETARAAPGILAAIGQADVVVLCPSNPWVSLDPILAVHDLRGAMEGRPAVGVSPIIAGRAVKGPAAKMCRELGIDPSARAVAEHYVGLLRGFVIDQADADQEAAIASLGMHVLVTRTVMRGRADRARLAKEVMAFASRVVSSEGEA
jgi:LPPG:FO 2-phospho-L-lactate transferase